MKTCMKCRSEKPVSEFQKNSSKSDGLQSYCRDCMNRANRESSARHAEAKRERNARYDLEHAEERKAYRTEWRKRNAERIKARNAAYREENREKIREAGRAYAVANRERNKARYAANPQPARDRAKAWRDRNIDKAKANNQRWKRENPERFREHIRLGQARRRARRKNLPTFDLSAKDLRRLLSSPCAVPGCPRTDIQIDHVIPVARGGSHGVGNFQPLCSSHNQSKRDRLWIEFRVYLVSREARTA